jgi:hypothetical protein
MPYSHLDDAALHKLTRRCLQDRRPLGPQQCLALQLLVGTPFGATEATVLAVGFTGCYWASFAPGLYNSTKREGWRPLVGASGSPRPVDRRSKVIDVSHSISVIETSYSLRRFGDHRRRTTQLVLAYGGASTRTKPQRGAMPCTGAARQRSTRRDGGPACARAWVRSRHDRRSHARWACNSTPRDH